LDLHPNLVHKSEEHSEGGKMVEDSVVTLESQPISIEVIFNTIIIFEVVEVSSRAKGFVLIQTFAPT
jgi:hypothetical protein